MTIPLNLFATHKLWWALLGSIGSTFGSVAVYRAVETEGIAHIASDTFNWVYVGFSGALAVFHLIALSSIVLYIVSAIALDRMHVKTTGNLYDFMVGTEDQTGHKASWFRFAWNLTWDCIAHPRTESLIDVRTGEITHFAQDSE